MDLACGLAYLQDNFFQTTADPIDGVDKLANLILAGNGQAGTQIACRILSGKVNDVTQRARQHATNDDDKQRGKQD